MKQKPSFQCYQQDFLGSTDFQLMTTVEVGCYWLMLLNLYNNGGRVDADIEALTILCRGVEPSKKVLKKFYARGGTLRHKRVDFELKKIKNFSKTQSENANKRWEKAKKGTMPSQSRGNAMASDRECSLSSSLSSTSIGREPPPRKKTTPEDNTQAQQFFEYCGKRKMKAEISAEKYLELREEYSDRVPWWEEVRGCIDLCYDKGFKTINANRLRNRMKMAIKIQKDRALKQQQVYQDKKSAVVQNMGEKTQDLPDLTGYSGAK